MSTVRILTPGGNIIETVVKTLLDAGQDLDRSLVVFPGKRPSHFVRKRLAEVKTTAFLSPTLLSYDELIDALARKLGMPGPALDPLDASAILFEIHRSAGQSVGDHFTTFEEFLPLGLRLYEEYEELTLSRPSEKALDETIGSISYGRRHALAEYYRRFMRTLNERGLTTRASRLALAADRFGDIDWSEYATIVLAGFYALTPVDQILFKKFLGLPHVHAFFQDGPGLAEQLSRLDLKADTGSERSGADAGEGQMDLFGRSSGEGRAPRESPRMHLYKASDLHGQVFALSSLLHSTIEKEGPPDERTVIVLPSSEGLFPVVQQALPLLPADGYNVSLGYPLGRTPLYAFVSIVLDLAATHRDGSLQASAYQQLTLHPYVKNFRYGSSPDVTRVLFQVIEEIIARSPSTTVRLEDLESNDTVIDRVVRAFAGERMALSRVNLSDHLRRIHDLIVRPFLQTGTIGDLAHRFADLIRVIEENGSAHRHPLFRRTAERFLEIAEGMQGSIAAAASFSSPEGPGIFLRTQIAMQTVPFPGTPLAGLQVLGLLETRNLPFDRVILLDATDSNIPGSGGIERLVPQGARTSLGMETARDRERLIEYYVNVLLAGAREVHLFFREEHGEERSRFIQKLLWRREQEETSGREEQARAIRYGIHLATPGTPAVAKSNEQAAFLKEFEFSATSLDQYLKCPLRFYYHYVLGLKEREEVAEDVEQYTIGSIVHEILKEFFLPMVGRSLKSEDLDPDRMNALTEEVFASKLGRDLKGGSLLLKEQTAGRLKEFLHDYQEQVLKDQVVEILDVEQTLAAVKDGHHFSGRIDRIERRGGKIYILDYKIRQDDTPYKIRWRKFAAEKPETWPESIGSLQLPLYQLMYSALTGTSPEAIVPVYVFVGRNQLNLDIEQGITEEHAPEDKHARLAAVIDGIAREIKDPSRPFEPTKDQKKVCPGCPYQVICGTQWAKEGRW